ncbi:hypothetical protein, partial [Streptococcus dysgalactiae]|uniref:hypothetical protein n=1 Tax=Streptococcus dysgalactiae TaxID=1334 RepID=UPI001950EE4E
MAIGLKGETSEMLIKTLHGSRQTTCSEVSLQLKSMAEDFEITVDKAFVIKDLPLSRIRDAESSWLDQWPHLRHIKFEMIADNRVGILLGCDIPEAHWVLDQRLGASNHPFALRSPLGWVLRGPVSRAYNSRLSSYCIETADITRQIKNLYELEYTEEELVGEKAHSEEDRSASCLVEANSRFTDGHYELPLPWRESCISLPCNRWLAEKRLSLLKTRLKNKPAIMIKYRDTIRDHERKGYVRHVSNEKAEQARRWFLPHHYVLNPNKPGKVRVVFDCAASHKG